MGIGIGIFLIALGAILTFAVSDPIQGVDVTMVGYICMGVGALSLVIALIINAQRSNTSHTQRVEHTPADPRNDPPPAV